MDTWIISSVVCNLKHFKRVGMVYILLHELALSYILGYVALYGNPHLCMNRVQESNKFKLYASQWNFIFWKTDNRFQNVLWTAIDS